MLEVRAAVTLLRGVWLGVVELTWVLVTQVSSSEGLSTFHSQVKLVLNTLGGSLNAFDLKSNSSLFIINCHFPTKVI